MHETETYWYSPLGIHVTRRKRKPKPEIEIKVETIEPTPKYLRKVHTPFSPARVKALNKFQTCYLFIPVKCRVCDVPLIAQRRGLACKTCGRRQLWAHKYMTCLQ